MTISRPSVDTIPVTPVKTHTMASIHTQATKNNISSETYRGIIRDTEYDQNGLAQ